MNARICALKSNLKNELLDELYMEIVRLNEDREEREFRKPAKVQKKKYRNLTNTGTSADTDQAQPAAVQSSVDTEDIKKK